MIRSHSLVLALLCTAAALIYWPRPDAEFVLDDYYTIVHNPLIKQDTLYPAIWRSRLFDAHKSSSYIKLLYYRPVLQSSYIIDYRLFDLNPAGYKWVNILIHVVNAFLVYWLCLLLFGQSRLALGASMLFLTLPTHEWVVRYITGRGDSLQALFGLLFLLSLLRIFRRSAFHWYVLAFISLIFSALTREFGYLMPLYGALLFYVSSQKKGPAVLALGWTVIGCLSFTVTYQIIPKLGSIQALHLLYFTSIGVCMWLAKARLKFVMALCLAMGLVSADQGRYWGTEQNLLRHVHMEEGAGRTVAVQQLLMKYDENIPAIDGILDHEKNPIIQSMWFKRFGDIALAHGRPMNAAACFQNALRLNPRNVDALDGLAICYFEEGRNAKGTQTLRHALDLDKHYPDTTRLWGIYFYRHRDFQRAKTFLAQSLYYDPDNSQAKALLRTINP